MKCLIGREKEKREIEKFINSDKSEFIAIYGRRRIGKTFLVTQFLKGKIDFDMTGIIGGSKEDQLMSFCK